MMQIVRHIKIENRWWIIGAYAFISVVLGIATGMKIIEIGDALSFELLIIWLLSLFIKIRITEDIEKMEKD